MNNSMNKISDPTTRNDIKNLLKSMSKTLVDNSNSLVKSHEVVSKTNDPLRKQKLQNVHNELQDTNDSFRNRFARILGDMKYLVDDPKDRNEIEQISNNLQNSQNSNIDDFRLARDLENLGNTCLDTPVNIRREPPIVNKIVKQPSNSSFEDVRNDNPHLINPGMRPSMLTPGRVIQGASRSPIRTNIHGGTPIVRKMDDPSITMKPTGATTAYTNKYSPITTPSPMPISRRLEPSKSTNALTPQKRIVPVQRGLTPSRSYNNLTPLRGSSYRRPSVQSPENQAQPQSFRPSVTNPTPRYSNVIQTPGKVIPTATTAMKSPTPAKRYRRLENGELVEIGPNDPPLYQAASPITKPRTNVFKPDPATSNRIINTNPNPPYRASSPTLKTSNYIGTPIKSSNRVSTPTRYTNRDVVTDPESFKNSRRFVLPQSPSFEPVKKKDINLMPMAPPQQKYNKKRERLRSLSKSRSPAINRVQPSNVPVTTNFNNSNLPIENISGHTTNPGDVRNTPIYDEKFASGLQNGEYVRIFLNYFRLLPI